MYRLKCCYQLANIALSHHRIRISHDWEAKNEVQNVRNVQKISTKMTYNNSNTHCDIGHGVSIPVFRSLL